MVLYHYSGIVPANTTATNPFWEKLKIMKGTIVQWIPFQPDECADLLKFWVSYHGFQLFPFNPDIWAYGFYLPIGITDEIELDDSPYELDFYAINLDDTYAHEYHMYINIKPPEPITTGVTTNQSLIDKLRQLFGG